MADLNIKHLAHERCEVACLERKPHFKDRSGSMRLSSWSSWCRSASQFLRHSRCLVLPETACGRWLSSSTMAASPAALEKPFRKCPAIRATVLVLATNNHEPTYERNVRYAVYFSSNWSHPAQSLGCAAASAKICPWCVGLPGYGSSFPESSGMKGGSRTEPALGAVAPCGA